MIRAAVLVPAPDYAEPFQWAYEVEAEALRRGGFSVEPRVWSEPGDLAWFDVVLPLVAWGYQSAPDRWFALLDRLDGGPVPIINPVPVLRWNSDKRYLAELAANGVTTVPTRVVEQLDRPSLASARATFGDELVIKPPISASAYGTHRLGPDDAIPDDSAGRTMMVQPFLRSIIDEGEYSLVFLGGEFSHAIIKNATEGDYRVQPHLGGSEVPCAAPGGGIEVAIAALAVAPAAAAYARVDLIRLSDGRLAVIELELIEPSLWLQHAPDGGASFAAAVRRAIGH